MSSTIDPIIGHCRKCKNEIRQSHPYVWCEVCNEPITDDVNLKRKPNRRDAHADAHDEPVSASGDNPRLMNRYTDAYVVARFTNGIRRSFKGLGIVLAIIFILIGFFMAISSRESATFGLGVVIAVFGVFTGVQCYILGVLIAALGQILKACLDVAVNSSPLLTNENKAKMMTLSVS